MEIRDFEIFSEDRYFYRLKEVGEGGNIQLGAVIAIRIEENWQKYMNIYSKLASGKISVIVPGAQVQLVSLEFCTMMGVLV